MDNPTKAYAGQINKFLRFSTLFLSSFCLPDANAAKVDPLETIYVIGLPGTHSKPNIPPDAIIIDREQLASYGSASLSTILEQVANISINQNGGRGSFNSLFLRGADPNFTQVRIDGVVINNATNTRGGAFDLSSINAQIIERIEIIADASSAIYGSQALAGIINIVTRSASFESAIEFDSHGGQVASIFAANDNMALSVVRERPQSILSGSEYESDELGGKLKWAWSDRHHLQLVGRLQQYHSTAFPDDSGGDLFSINRQLEQRRGDITHLSSHYNYLTDNGNYFELNASFLEQQEQRLTPAVAPGVRDPFGLPEILSDTEYQRSQLEARFTRQLNEKLLWRSSLNWEQETGKEQGELDFSFFQLDTDFKLSRDTFSLSQSLEFDITNNLQLIVGGRIDDTSTDTIFSPRISLSYRFDDARQLLYATGGEGFKQASIYALADPVIGNASLLDETAESFQLGHRYKTEKWQLKHNAYYYKFTNLIDFDAGPPPSLVNRNSVRVRGLESIIELKLNPAWQIDLFQSYTSMDVADSSTTLRNRPRYRAGVQINYKVTDKFNTWLKSRIVGSQLDSSIATGAQTLDQYELTDLGFRWRFKPRWQLNAQWKNIFSKEYSNSIGNPVTGDTVLLQFTYQGPKIF